MTTLETKTDEISEVQKSDPVEKSTEPSVVSILAQLVKSQEARLDSQEATFDKKFDALTALIKENANPVDHGVEAENKPKTEDANDVGDKVTIGNEIAPSPKDQASIVAPAVESSGSDKEGLKMENKAEDEDKKDNADKATEDEEKPTEETKEEKNEESEEKGGE